MRIPAPSTTLCLVACLALCVAACGERATPAADTARRVDAPPVAGATGAAGTLQGVFEIARVQANETWITLRFDEEGLSMAPETLVKVEGRGDAAVDAAAASLTAIHVAADAPEAGRLSRACAAGCTLEAVVAAHGTDQWRLRTLREVTPHPPLPPLDVGRGDPRRKPLLDALRPHIEADLGQRLIFQVRILREHNGSAFAVVQPRTPAGRPIDFAGTRHAQRLADGVLDSDSVYALLQQRDGAWQVREFVVGPTDVAWAGWAQDYSAPDDIFNPGE